jgi:hypothetical protein
MKNGSYFERSYIPDEHKRIVGPIEEMTDDRMRFPFLVAVALGIICGLIAIGRGIL